MQTRVKNYLNQLIPKIVVEYETPKNQKVQWYHSNHQVNKFYHQDNQYTFDDHHEHQDLARIRKTKKNKKTKNLRESLGRSSCQ